MNQEEYIQASIENHKVQRRHLQYVKNGIIYDIKSLNKQLELSEHEDTGLDKDIRDSIKMRIEQLNGELQSLELNIGYVDSVISKYS